MNISFSILAIIAGILLCLQIILAIFNKHNFFKSALRLDFLVSSQVNMVEVLQLYSRIEGTVNIKVNADIPLPAVFENNLLLVKRDWVYQHRAVPSLWLLRTLRLGERKQTIRKYRAIQQILFALTLITIGLSTIQITLVVLALILQIITILLGFRIESLLDYVHYQALQLAKDFLDLSEHEAHQIGRAHV